MLLFLISPNSSSPHDLFFQYAPLYHFFPKISTFFISSSTTVPFPVIFSSEITIAATINRPPTIPETVTFSPPIPHAKSAAKTGSRQNITATFIGFVIF